MKKLLFTIALIGLVALPVNAAVQKATLISPSGVKVVVTVGAQAQQYFAAGYTLLGSAKPLIIGSSMPNTAVDLIGTRVGTSTTGVAFTSTSTITSYTKFVGSDVDEAILSITPTAASSATVLLNVFGSNDSQCDTATTTSTTLANKVDINWYDLNTNILNLAGSNSAIVAATSTITWSPTGAKQGKQLVLTNLNNQCLRFDVAATSTTLYAQLKTKQK